MISTGLQRLDEFLPGGMPGGVITDIFGPHGTGKTQFLFQLSFNAAKSDNGRVLYVDTSGRFRPERIIEIQKQNGSAPDIDKITVLRVTNTSEQVGSLRIIDDSDFDAVLVDNITDLFSYEYQSGEQAFERNMLFMQYMRGLSLHAIDKKIPIVVTNMVRQVDDKETENMQTAIDPFTHIKIRLSRDGAKLSGRAAWLQKRLDFSYRIHRRGLLDAAEAI